MRVESFHYSWYVCKWRKTAKTRQQLSSEIDLSSCVWKAFLKLPWSGKLRSIWSLKNLIQKHIYRGCVISCFPSDRIPFLFGFSSVAKIIPFCCQSAVLCVRCCKTLKYTTSFERFLRHRHSLVSYFAIKWNESHVSSTKVEIKLKFADWFRFRWMKFPFSRNIVF